MDFAKVESEFELYGFTLEDFKKEHEKVFRLHCKKVFDTFSNNVIAAAEKEMAQEEVAKIKEMAAKSLDLIKPETTKMLSKINALVDKHFTVPDTVLFGESNLSNTPDMGDYEKTCKQDIAEYEKIYKQQAIMIAKLKKELALYDEKLLQEAQIDNGMCELFENNFTQSNLEADVIDNVIGKLKEIGIESSIN